MTHVTPDELEAAAATAVQPPHLNECPACREQWRAMKGRQAIFSGLTPYTLSDMAFRRVEASVMEHAARPSTPLRSLWWWLVPAALALVVIAFAVRPPETGSALSTSLSAIAVPVPAADQFALTVLRASPDAQSRRDATEWQHLAIGTVVERGTQLQASWVDFAAVDAKWAFSLKGRGAVAGSASLTLATGVVTADISSHTADVVTGRFHCLATDAAFLLERTAAEVVLEVSRGEVLLTDGSSQRRVRAPARLRWSDETPAFAGQSLPPGGFALPARSPPPWALVQAPAGADFSALDGVSLEQRTAEMMLSLGRHELRVHQGQVERSVRIDLSSAQPLVMKSLLADASEAPLNDDTVKRLSSELAQQTPRLAACYEKWLKATTASEGSLDLVLTISAQGRVTRANVSHAPNGLPQAVADCLTLASRRLVLSPIGSNTEFVLPLVLRPKGR